MFHRVKSETAVKEDIVEETVEQEAPHSAAQIAQRAQKSTTMSQQELDIEDGQAAEETEAVAAEALETEEPAPAYTPAQSLYQRPAISRPGAAAYSPRPASYNPTAEASRVRAPAAASENSENDRRLTIGRGITMSGEIECCDELQVEGTVEAALKGASFLNITESGVFYGTVEIEDAVIAGRFEGEIIVNGRLTVEETGVITGSISYKELEIKSGAIVDGRITPLSAPVATKGKKDAA
jgi:cytoskeletal protein CcmA (bactofilin family)